MRKNVGVYRVYFDGLLVVFVCSRGGYTVTRVYHPTLASRRRLVKFLFFSHDWVCADGRWFGRIGTL